jgi:hypothetical protein
MTSNSLHHDQRGQQLTLSALLAGLILLSSLVTAMTLTPATGTREAAADLNQRQLQQDVQDILQIAQTRGTLKDTVTYWDTSDGDWANNPTGSSYYVQAPSGHPMHDALSNVLVENGYGYYITLVYKKSGGGTEMKRHLYQGAPGNHAVVAETKVVLQDSDNLHGPDSSETVSSASNFYAPDAFSGSTKYNVIRVRLIAWNA